MTIKEYNAVRAAIYAAGMDNLEIKSCIDRAGICFLYEVTQLDSGAHKVFTLTDESQMNANTLREAGFDPDKCDVKLRLVYHQQTKCVTFAAQR